MEASARRPNWSAVLGSKLTRWFRSLDVVGVITKFPPGNQGLFMQVPPALSHVRMLPKELAEGALLKFSFCDGQNRIDQGLV